MLDEEYEDKALIPDGWAHLYIEKDGKWLLMKSSQVKSQADVDRLMESLRKERSDHKTTRVALDKFGDLDPEETQTQLDRIPELEVAAEGKLDDTKIDGIVETRVRAKLAPLERENKTLKQTNLDQANTIKDNEASTTTRAIKDAVRVAATDAKLVNDAVHDVLDLSPHIFTTDETGRIITKADNVHGVAEGLEPKDYFVEMQSKRANWWPENVAAGARGSSVGGSGPNPWSLADWNLTKQGEIMRKDRKRADSLAKAAGTTIGGPKPSK